MKNNMPSNIFETRKKFSQWKYLSPPKQRKNNKNFQIAGKTAHLKQLNFVKYVEILCFIKKLLNACLFL